MESSNSKERELQMTHRIVKQRHSHCMTWFEQLETHLRDLYLNNSSHAVDAFKPAFRTFFGEEHQTFRLKMFHNLDQLRLQLERENLHKVNAKTYFKEYTLCKPDTYRCDLLENLDTLEAVIHRAVITYGILRMKENEVNALKVNGKQLNEEILHEHEIKKRFKLQSQDVQINPVQAVDGNFIVSKSSWIESETNNALSKSVNETQLQQHESLVTESTTLEDNLNTDVKALDVGSVITESSGTKSDKRDTSSSSGNYITHAVDADFRPVNGQVPFAEVQLTAQHIVIANKQQHIEQSEPIYDTYLLEKVDSNNTPNSTNMSHKGEEIDRDAEQYQVKTPLLNVELSKTKEMIEKEIYNELSHKFLLLEKHCISLELEIQQKDASFQSNKPESAPAKPHHVNAPSSSRNCQKESYGSNDMAHNHFLEEARKKSQDINWNLKPREMPSAKTHHTPNACTPKPRSNNQTWKPTGRIFMTAGLRWIPTRKMFTNSTTKVDNEPPDGSNDDITNLYECDQTLNVSAGTLNLSEGPAPQRKERCTLQCALSLKEEKSSYLRAVLSTTSISSHARSVNKWINDSCKIFHLQHPLSHQQRMTGIHCFNLCLMSTSNLHQMLIIQFLLLQSPSSTTVDQDAPSTSTSQTTSEQLSSVIPQGVEDDFHDIEVAYMDNDPYFGIPIPEPSSEETNL
ncbi:hypothetical protein Tco_1051050 [Tanacetum coccineum]